MTNLTPELQAMNERIKAFNAKRQASLKPAKTKIKVETSVNQHGALVGDVLCAVWGYEQTNYDFYEVVKVTAKTITIEKLNGYDKGTILKNKKTQCYMRDGSEYLVNLNSYSNAKCRINDRYAKGMYKQAEDEMNNPYRSRY
ncbi:hypothetical protein HO551_11315 [Streptococcus suis]|uniref:hypothetical protein n=1 Tax=Streptococcus suis TaxID=1307 RepID=UPI000CF4EEBD|nr:hypothetical protein [Streptococcus suis]MCO8179512.1 hypothetical protein [Streptococcus suis]NQJ51266.1 hypothetical protein [Streptococcus suis]NQJ53429.1 hypothetical protein [Streptococcus suis]NQJ57774.1 hypothetical protein [Streptococcus suis]HEM3466781.1 hypothetical protein [Streptococcus suis]